MNTAQPFNPFPYIIMLLLMTVAVVATLLAIAKGVFWPFLDRLYAVFTGVPLLAKCAIWWRDRVGNSEGSGQ